MRRGCCPEPTTSLGAEGQGSLVGARVPAMRHRSSVAVVESDQGELHLVLSPARSIDTHVVRCAPRVRRDSFSRLSRGLPRGRPILRFRALPRLPD